MKPIMDNGFYDDAELVDIGECLGMMNDAVFAGGQICIPSKRLYFELGRDFDPWFDRCLVSERLLIVPFVEILNKLVVECEKIKSRAVFALRYRPVHVPSGMFIKEGFR